MVLKRSSAKLCRSLFHLKLQSFLFGIPIGGGGGRGGKWRGNQKSITPENSASRFKPSSQGSSQKVSALPGATEQV